MTLKPIGCFLALLTALVLPASSYASVVLDLSAGSPTGSLGATTYTDAGTGLKIDAFFLSGSSWVSTDGTTTADLFRRATGPGDRGFGVCSEGPTLCGITGTGGNGNWNELSNN